MFVIGATQPIGLSHISANAWRTLQVGNRPSRDGNATQLQLVADYGLSARTSVYAEVDYSWYAGDLIGAQLRVWHRQLAPIQLVQRIALRRSNRVVSR
jgi:predicted porin